MLVHPVGIRTATPASEPTAIIVENPMAESMNTGPPTQSQNPEHVGGVDAECDTFLRAGDTATEADARRPGVAPSPCSSQSRALLALNRLQRGEGLPDDR